MIYECITCGSRDIDVLENPDGLICNNCNANENEIERCKV